MAPYAEEGCKLFVYGVNENTSNSELSDAFSKYGTVVDTYNTGKGYAFVTFDNKDDAQTATDQLNGQEILGQQVISQFELSCLIMKNFSKISSFVLQLFSCRFL